MSKYDYRDFLDNKYYCANVRIREAEVNDILPNPNDVKILYESFLKAKAFDIIVKKRVNINLLFESVEQYNYETVTLGSGADYYKLLTHEEYDLIKKALEEKE